MFVGVVVVGGMCFGSHFGIGMVRRLLWLLGCGLLCGRLCILWLSGAGHGGLFGRGIPLLCCDVLVMLARGLFSGAGTNDSCFPLLEVMREIKIKILSAGDDR